MASAYEGLPASQALSYDPTGNRTAVQIGGSVYPYIAEIRFIEDQTSLNSPSAAEREEMIWNMRVDKEGGSWKLWL